MSFNQEKQGIVKDFSGFDNKDISPKTIKTIKTTTDILNVRKRANIQQLATGSLDSNQITLNGEMNTTDTSNVDLNGLITINNAVYVLTIEQLEEQLAQAAVTGGKSIIVAPGTFNVSSQLVIPANTDIRGSGINTTIFQPISGFSGQSMFKFGGNNSSITDLQLNGGGQSINLLIINGVSNIVLNLLNFKNSNGNHIIIEKSNNIDITETFFSGKTSGSSNHFIYIGYGAKRVNFIGCSMSDISSGNCIHIYYESILGNSSDNISTLSFTDFSVNDISTGKVCLVSAITEALNSNEYNPGALELVKNINFDNFTINDSKSGEECGPTFDLDICNQINISNINIENIVYNSGFSVFNCRRLNNLYINKVIDRGSSGYGNFFSFSREIINLYLTDCIFESETQNNTSRLINIVPFLDGVGCRNIIISRIRSVNFGKVLSVIGVSNFKFLDSDIISGNSGQNFTLEFTADFNDLRNIFIRGNRFIDTSSHGTQNEFGTIRIFNNRFEFKECENINIEGNTIQSNGTFCVMEGPVSKLNITTNTVYGNGTLCRGVYIVDEVDFLNSPDPVPQDGTDYVLENINISNNIVEFPNGGDFIRFSTSFRSSGDFIVDKVSVFNNQVKTSDGDFIRLSLNETDRDPACNDFFIQNNTFDLISTSGFSSLAEVATTGVLNRLNINNNSAITRTGIEVSGFIKNTVITNNNLVFNGLSGGVFGIALSIRNVGGDDRLLCNVSNNIVFKYLMPVIIIPADVTSYFSITNNSFDNVNDVNETYNTIAPIGSLLPSDLKTLDIPNGKNITIRDNEFPRVLTDSTFDCFYISHLMCDTSSNNITVTMKNILPKSKGQKCKVELIDSTNDVTVQDENGDTLAILSTDSSVNPTTDDFLIFEWDGRKWGYNHTFSEFNSPDITDPSNPSRDSGVMDWNIYRQGNIVTVNYRFDGFVSPTVNFVDFRLPVGFRPKQDVLARNAIGASATSIFIHIWVRGDKFRIAPINYSGSPVNFGGDQQIDGCVTYVVD